MRISQDHLDRQTFIIAYHLPVDVIILLLQLVETCLLKEVFVRPFAIGIIDLPSEDIPESTDEVADGEDDDDKSEHSEGVVYHNLQHNVVVILQLVMLHTCIFKHSVQFPIVVGFYDLFEVPGVQEEEEFGQTQNLKQSEQLSGFTIGNEISEWDHTQYVENERALEISNGNFLMISNWVEILFAYILSEKVYTIS